MHAKSKKEGGSVFYLIVAALIVAAVIIFLVAFSAPIRAQEAINLVPDRPWWVGLLLEFKEPLVIIVLALFGGVGTWVGRWAVKWFGQDTANKLQESFQAAAGRAAALAFMRLGIPAGSGIPPSAAVAAHGIEEGVAYLKKTMPDTIAKLGVDDAGLRKVVEANLGKMLAK